MPMHDSHKAHPYRAAFLRERYAIIRNKLSHRNKNVMPAKNPKLSQSVWKQHTKKQKYWKQNEALRKKYSEKEEENKRLKKRITKLEAQHKKMFKEVTISRISMAKSREHIAAKMKEMYLKEEKLENMTEVVENYKSINQNTQELFARSCQIVAKLRSRERVHQNNLRIHQARSNANISRLPSIDSTKNMSTNSTADSWNDSILSKDDLKFLEELNII